MLFNVNFLDIIEVLHDADPIHDELLFLTTDTIWILEIGKYLWEDCPVRMEGKHPIQK